MENDFFQDFSIALFEIILHPSHPIYIRHTCPLCTISAPLRQGSRLKLLSGERASNLGSGSSTAFSIKIQVSYASSHPPPVFQVRSARSLRFLTSPGTILGLSVIQKSAGQLILIVGYLLFSLPSEDLFILTLSSTRT